MPSSRYDRRSFLTHSAAGAAAVAGSAVAPLALAADATAPAPAKRYQNNRSPWPICLDTATIRPATLEQKIDIAAEAGYDAIEPWEGELHKYETDGGDLKDLGKKIADKGLLVPSVIGLWNGIPATKDAWDKQLPEHRRRMRQSSAIGAQHIQVVPQPQRPWQEFDLKWAADRYRELLEIGLGEFNINPAMVFVEFLPGVMRMGQAAAIAIDADHPKAKIIPDLFHMHIGDTGFKGLRHIRGDFIAIFQFNDAPAQPAKADLEDKHRVFPGDGILPLGEILRDLRMIGYTGCVSLELYNPEYHQRNLLEVAKEGLAKTVASIEKALT